jgi:DNA-binding response OmpR family regulator
MAKILVVEDERALAETIRDWLILEQHRVDVCHDGKEAQCTLSTDEYDVVMLDIMLPSVDGFEICRSYRRQGGTARILMITAKSTISDKEQGLDYGADDYITKPLDLNELSARVRALMRRSLTVDEPELVCADLRVQTNQRKVTRGGLEIKLLPQEFELLQFLIRQPHRIFSAETLVSRVWQGQSSTNTVRTHIKTLRRKLDLNGSEPLIRTIHGVGYSLSDRR